MSPDELEYKQRIYDLYKWVEELKSFGEDDKNIFYRDLLPTIALIQHNADGLRKITERLALENA